MPLAGWQIRARRRRRTRKLQADYEDFYRKVSGPVRRRPGGARALVLADKALVAIVAATFLGIAAWLAVRQDARVLRYLAVCAVSFAALSALRAALDWPRPYESFDIDPLVHKDTRGKSFPSRHIFSASVIACALLWLNAWLGAAGFAATAAIAVIRVVGGVHFPRDVVAGAAMGILCGVIGFWIV